VDFPVGGHLKAGLPGKPERMSVDAIGPAVLVGGPKSPRNWARRLDVDRALAQRRPTSPIWRSDRGSQFVSLAFGRQARAAGIAQSTGSRGDCFDNAVAASFFATLTKELIHARSRHRGRAQDRGLRVHRSLLRPPLALRARNALARAVRDDHPPSSSTTTTTRLYRACPSKRGKSRIVLHPVVFERRKPC
jgi:transposase InsO family protein